LFAGNEAEVFEKPGNEAVVRCGAGDIGEGDADFGAGSDPVAQRFGGDGGFERAEDSLLLVREAGDVERFDDGGKVVRQIDRQMALSVSEFNLHGESLIQKARMDTNKH
jgi:hypothetical protein